jgi:TRAP-type C4-dicarboxylate transport system permease small subunit
VYQRYIKFENLLLKVEKAIIMVAFTLIFVTVSLQVFQRFFDLPIPDTSDISLVCQGVFTFMSVGVLVFLGGHITIEAQKMIKSRTVLYAVEMFAYVVLLIFAGIFIWLGYDLFGFALETGTSTAALRIPLWIPYGTMLFGLILMVFHIIGAMMKLCYYWKNPSEHVEEEIDIENMR